MEVSREARDDHSCEGRQWGVVGVLAPCVVVVDDHHEPGRRWLCGNEVQVIKMGLHLGRPMTGVADDQDLLAGLSLFSPFSHNQPL